MTPRHRICFSVLSRWHPTTFCLFQLVPQLEFVVSRAWHSRGAKHVPGVKHMGMDLPCIYPRNGRDLPAGTKKESKKLWSVDLVLRRPHPRPIRTRSPQTGAGHARISGDELGTVWRRLGCLVHVDLLAEEFQQLSHVAEDIANCEAAPKSRTLTACRNEQRFIYRFWGGEHGS